MPDILKYEILALDPSEKTRCENAPSLLYMIRGFTSLWNEPTVREHDFQIVDGSTVLAVGEVKPPTEEDSVTDAAFGRAYIVSLHGRFDDIEPVRQPLTGFLKDQEFQLLYVLKDEVSEFIACQLYPHLYRIENLLRGYLIKFMSTRIGPTWWEVTVSREMTDKVKMRKKNERVFGKHVENSAYLVDFGELGEIIYEQSSGFVTREDIIKRINNLPETPEAIKDFKAELQTNYQKFFRESFADKDFKDKWKTFETLRNKIAHGNLFTAEDLRMGQQLAKEITDIITAADAQTEHLVITRKERDAIKDTVIERSSPWMDISEDQFLAQLEDQERYFERSGGFVGLARFVKFHLGGLGYDFRSSYELAQRLEAQNRVEIYHVENPHDDHPTAAVRRVAENPEYPAIAADVLPR